MPEIVIEIPKALVDIAADIERHYNVSDRELAAFYAWRAAFLRTLGPHLLAAAGVEVDNALTAHAGGEFVELLSAIVEANPLG